MNTFLPSEISRLTYGYLKTHCDQNLAEEFSKSCPSMKECRQMKHKYGRNFHSTVQDLTLETILDQYSLLCSSIFKYFDEDEREHRNVVNLLNIILRKHQPEQSTFATNSRAFQDIQNVPSNRIIPENQITEARGRENKLSVLKGTEMSGDEQTRTSPKKKTASSIRLTNQEPAVTNKSLLDPEAKVSPNRGREISQIIDSGLDHFSNLCQYQAAADDINTSNTQSNGLTSHLPPQKLILPSSNDIQLEIGHSIDSSLTKSSRKTDHHDYFSMLKEGVEKTDSQDTETLSSEPSLAKIKNVNFDNANNPSVIGSNDSSRLDLAFLNHSSTLAGKDGTFITENEETPGSSSGVINSPKIPISLSESAKTVSSDHSIRPTSLQADWKSIFCNSLKIPTPSKSTNQKIPENEMTVSKSTKTPTTIKEAVPPQEYIQVFFENLSKGFKHRPHPYLSPAKSKGLLHQAALSPLSKMYVTPTKPNSLNSAASNHSVASNATSTSSISSSQRSIFSPVSIDSPCTKKTPAREEPIQNNVEKMTLRPVSSTKETISAKRKKCHRQKPQLHYDLNDEIVKKVDKITNTKNIHVNATLDSRLNKKSKKEVTGCKNAQQVFIRDPDPAEEKINEIASKNEKDPRLIISSSEKSIQKSRNEGNYCKNERKVYKDDTEKTVPKSIQTFNTEEMFRKMVHRVFVKDTCEIAELDVSSEFLLYHRDSTHLSVYSAEDNLQ